MFLGVACIALLQLILCRGFILPTFCNNDSDCHCTEHFQAECIKGEYIPVHYCGECHQVKCSHDRDCHCTENFQAECIDGEHRHYCGTCRPVKCHHDGDCYCNDHNFQANCDHGEEGSHCSSCYQVANLSTPHTNPTNTFQSSTTAAVSTSTHVPTPAPPQSNCSEFDSKLHGCNDNSACNLTHVLPVICPDPNEAKYCPKACGCCHSP